MVILSVCPSVRPSVTTRYRSRITKGDIIQQHIGTQSVCCWILSPFV